MLLDKIMRNQRSVQGLVKTHQTERNGKAAVDLKRSSFPVQRAAQLPSAALIILDGHMHVWQVLTSHSIIAGVPEHAHIQQMRGKLDRISAT